jgi:hypothetical protein
MLHLSSILTSHFTLILKVLKVTQVPNYYGFWAQYIKLLVFSFFLMEDNNIDSGTDEENADHD